MTTTTENIKKIFKNSECKNMRQLVERAENGDELANEFLKIEIEKFKENIINFFDNSNCRSMQKIVEEAKNGDDSAIEMLRIEYDTQKNILKQNEISLDT